MSDLMLTAKVLTILKNYQIEEKDILLHSPIDLSFEGEYIKGYIAVTSEKIAVCTMTLPSSSVHLFRNAKTGDEYIDEELSDLYDHMIHNEFVVEMVPKGFNKGTGVVLIAFGIYMVVSMIVYQTNPKVREKEQESMPQSTKIIQSLHNHVSRDSNHMTKTVAEDTATIYMDTAAVMDSTADTTYLE